MFDLFIEYDYVAVKTLVFLVRLIHILLDIRFVLITYFIICLFVLAFFLLKKNRMLYTLYSRIYNTFFKFGLLLIFHILTYTAIKILVLKPRPYLANNIVSPGISFDDLSSFPSSHVGLALLIIIFFYRNSILYNLMSLFVIFLVGFARIIINKHYIIDCIGSIITTPCMYFFCICSLRKWYQLVQYIKHILYIFYKIVHKKLH